MTMPYFIRRRSDGTFGVVFDDPPGAVRAREARSATVADIEAWARAAGARSRARRAFRDLAGPLRPVDALIAAAVSAVVVAFGVGFWLAVWKLAELIARAVG
jgi:hypothetical protein